MNFIKNAVNKITNKVSAMIIKAETAITTAVEDVKAEFYIDKTVGVIICVVVGALLLGIVYAFVNENIATTLTEKINDMWNFAG